MTERSSECEISIEQKRNNVRCKSSSVTHLSQSVRKDHHTAFDERKRIRKLTHPDASQAFVRHCQCERKRAGRLEKTPSSDRERQGREFLHCALAAGRVLHQWTPRSRMQSDPDMISPPKMSFVLRCVFQFLGLQRAESDESRDEQDLENNTPHCFHSFTRCH